jgi:hypothetical protein
MIQMAITPVEQLKKLEEQQKSLQDKITKIKDKQLQKIGKLADKHDLATWDEKVLDKAFAFIKESGANQFAVNEDTANSEKT